MKRKLTNAISPVLALTLLALLFLMSGGCLAKEASDTGEPTDNTEATAYPDMTLEEQIDAAETFEEIAACQSRLDEEFDSKIPENREAGRKKEAIRLTNKISNKIQNYMFSGDILNGTYYFADSAPWGHSSDWLTTDSISIYVVNYDEIYIVPANKVTGDLSTIPDLPDAAEYEYEYKKASAHCSNRNSQMEASLYFKKNGIVKENGERSYVVLNSNEDLNLTISLNEANDSINISGLFEYQYDSRGNQNIAMNREYYRDSDTALAVQQASVSEHQDREKEREALANSAPKVGMTKTQVESSLWGKPDRKNIDEYSWGTTEQWVYDKYGYVYFENGIVSSVSKRN